MTRKIGGAVVSDRSRETREFDAVSVYPGISVIPFVGAASSGTDVFLGKAVYLPFRGSVVGISVSGSTSGTYKIFVNGSETGDLVYFADRLTATSGTKSYRKGKLPVKAGDYIQVKGESTGAVALFLVLDPASTI